MMPKFKVGDRVKVTKAQGGKDVYLGRTGTIFRTYDYEQEAWVVRFDQPIPIYYLVDMVHVAFVADNLDFLVETTLEISLRSYISKELSDA